MRTKLRNFVKTIIDRLLVIFLSVLFAWLLVLARKNEKSAQDILIELNRQALRAQKERLELERELINLKIKYRDVAEEVEMIEEAIEEEQVN